jgi:hypothetical protein
MKGEFPNELYPVDARSPMFEGLDDVQFVFHGINKSGSKSMASVLRRALIQEKRADEDLSHYHCKPAIPIEEFRSRVEAKDGRSMVVGHYLYGYLSPRPRRIWVTQFRHPLPRIVSAYHWLKNKHIAARGTAEGFTSFSKFVYASRGVTHSQVMQLGRGFGRYGESDAKMSLSGEMLFELTIEALERDFTAIAIAERFEESIFTFAGLLGIKAVDSWRKDERNKGRPPIDELTVAERGLVREVYHWDYRLYDWALQKFEEQCSKIDFGPSLAEYQRACSGQYKDRLVGDSADDAVARWLTGKWRRENPATPAPSADVA